MRSAIVLVPSFFLACTTPVTTNPNTQNNNNGNNNNQTPVKRTYSLSSVPGCAQGGTQTSIAARANKVALVTLAPAASQSTCNNLNGSFSIDDYSVCYAQSVAGGSFTTQDLATVPYLTLTGVAVAINAAGNSFVGYTGPDDTDRRCGGSDMVMREQNGANFGAVRTIAADSVSGYPAGPGDDPQCVQNVCNTGDVTGLWPALAIDASDRPMLAFRDMHFGLQNDDFISSDVEFARGPGYPLYTVDVSRGGGKFTHIASLPGGGAAVAHYNGERDSSVNGIWVHGEVAGMWQTSRATGARIEGGLGFAVSPSGLYAVAYYDADNARLSYTESLDGLTWSLPEDVDTDGITGQYPSLAFDANGEPAIAYYRCRDYHPTERGCLIGEDGLYLARRSGGTWQRDELSARRELRDGMYTALAFVGGKAVVAFQTLFFDVATGQDDAALEVAREQ